MSVWANIGGTWRKSTLWENVGGTWRKLTPWVNVGGAWKKDPSPSDQTLAVAASPDSVSGAISRPGSGIATTNEATASVTGGAAPYTYTWNSSDGVMVATAATSPTTRFSAPVDGGDALFDTFTVLVTDAKGQTATATVLASVYNYGKPV